MDHAMRFADAGAVRAVLDNGRHVLEVLAAPYGSAARPDRLGQWFTPRTDFMLTGVGDRRPALYMHGFSPDKRMMAKPVLMGVAEVSRIDGAGLWMLTEIDDSEFAARTWRAAQAGKARASTGSIEYLVRPQPRPDGRYPPGEVEVWPIAELSVFDGGPDRVPVSDDAVVLPLRAIFAAAKLDFPEALGEGAEDGEQKDAAASVASVKPERTQFAIRSVDMEPKDVVELIDQTLTAREKRATDAKAAEDAIRADERKKIEADPAARRALFSTRRVTKSAFRLTEKEKAQGLEVADLEEAHEYMYALRMAGLNRTPFGGVSFNSRAPDALRVLEESEALEGGPMVPAAILNKIWEKKGVYSIVRRSGMDVYTTDKLITNVPTETAAMAVSPTIAEEGAYVANEPAFVSTAVTALKKGDMVTATEEMLEDQALFQGYLVRAVGKALGLAENAVLYACINTIDGVEIAVTHTPSDAEVLALYGRLPQEYRDGACFIMNDAWFMHLRSMLVATPRAYGELIGFGPSGVPGETFLGKAAYTNGNWTDMTAGNDVLIISFLNLSESIAWVDRRGLKLFVDPYGDAVNGRVRFFPSARFACAVANSDGMEGMDDHA